MLRNHVILLLFSILLSSCVHVEPLELRSVVCCQLKKSVGSETEVAFQVELFNPNTFPIHVRSYELDVRINGNTIGTATKNESVRLNPNSVYSENVTTMVSTQKIVSGTLLMGLTALFKADPTTLDIEVVGTVVGSAKGVSKRLKVKEKYPLQMHP